MISLITFSNNLSCPTLGNVIKAEDAVAKEEPKVSSDISKQVIEIVHIVVDLLLVTPTGKVHEMHLTAGLFRILHCPCVTENF